MDMPGNDPNVEPPSDWHSIPNNTTNPSTSLATSFCTTLVWDPQINEQIPSHSDANARNEASTSSPSRAGDTNWTLRQSMLNSTFPSMVPPLGLPDFPEDSGFINRAARFSCFVGGNLGHMINPFTNLGHANADSRSRLVQWPNEALAGDGPEGSPFKNEARITNFRRAHDEVDNGLDEFSCSEGREKFSGKGVELKKRKREEKKIVDNENNETEHRDIETEKDTNEINKKIDEKNRTLIKKTGGKGLAPPKEGYIHVRARRGQATNSHSLAERIRREKISERMKFLQDLVPGCSKVTGKAVMLDEIINYVQSLQRQVEFLSMKLATVNPGLDFNMEEFLAKTILQTRADLSSSLVFSTEMITSFSPIQPAQARLIDPTTLHRPIGSQSNVVFGGSRQLTSRASGIWDDDLHSVVHNGFNLSASF